MTDMSKPTSSERKVRFESRVLTDDELDAISGGSGMVSQVLKNFGEAAEAAARKSQPRLPTHIDYRRPLAPQVLGRGCRSIQAKASPIGNIRIPGLGVLSRRL